MASNQEWYAEVLNAAPGIRFNVATERMVGLENQLMSGYILVVDDDPDAQEVLTRILTGLGYGTRIADDGHHALGVISDEFPDLIMLDLLMPRMDGFTFLSSLRGNPATRRIPVVVVTACHPGQVDMLRLPGVSQVIQKGTYTIKSLEKLVGDLMSDSGSAPGKPNSHHNV